MTRSAQDLLEELRDALAPVHDENRLVPMIARGSVSRGIIGALAAEEQRIVTSDWRSFLTLAARSPDPAGRAFFGGLAQGESLALPTLVPLAAACGLTEAAVRVYQPLPGCQAYPLRSRTSGERDANQPQARDQTEPSVPNATNTFNPERRNSAAGDRRGAGRSGRGPATRRGLRARPAPPVLRADVLEHAGRSGLTLRRRAVDAARVVE